jgi:photosystem II stability/assembly factor-like uncharacterized protein
MPRRLLLILPILALTTLALAPGAQAAGLVTSNPAWTWLNPLPHGDQLDAVAYRAGSEAWAVGLTRGFFKTTDDGATWSVTRTGPPLGFMDVAFADAQHGVAVGESSNAWDFTDRDLVWRTSDGGTTWFSARIAGSNSPLADVSFGDASNGWAAGRYGTILHSADAGATWTPQVTPAEVTGIDLTGVSFVDVLHGWATGVNITGGDSYVLRTVDGGVNWLVVDQVPSSFLFICDFVDQQNGWACGWFGNLWHTSDGGASWAKQTLPGATDTTVLLGLEFVSGTSGWAVSADGKIYGTTNAGATWTIQKTIAGASLSGIAFRDATHGIVSGDDGELLTTADGLTWTDKSSGERTALLDSAFVGGGKGWAVGFNGTVLRTTNGGEKWTAKTASTSKHLVAVDFVTSTRGWVAGRSGTIMATTNGGSSWKRQKVPTKLDLNGIDFVSTTKGWAVGAGAAIVATTNGGRTWKRQKCSTQVDLSHVEFVDATHGWAAAMEKGVILRTTDGGKHWTKSVARVLPWPGGYICDLCFVDRKHGWACGISPAGADTLGTVFGTSNGGRSWKVLVPSKSFVIAEEAAISVEFRDRSTGWIVGEHGYLALTTNGGKTWQQGTRIAPDETLFDVEFVSKTVGYVVGTGGTIVKTTTGGK